MSTGPDPIHGFTVAQRLHLDIDGYVVVERLFSADEVAEMRDVIFRIEAHFRATGEFLHGSKSMFTRSEAHFRIDNLGHVAPCFHRYLMDPRITSKVEEMVGGEARVEQSDISIRRPHGETRHGFHRASRLGLGFVENGLYHYPFVKALTNLSDLGPDDGGTVVIAGSHKAPQEVHQPLVDQADRDSSFVHQVVAPAGSTVFFFESLIHGSGFIRSGRDRPFVIGGYTPTLFQAQRGYEPEPAFLATLSEEHRVRYAGGKGWEGQEWYRKLE